MKYQVRRRVWHAGPCPWRIVYETDWRMLAWWNWLGFWLTHDPPEGADSIEFQVFKQTDPIPPCRWFRGLPRDPID